MLSWKLCIAAAGLVVACGAIARAQTAPMVYIHDAPESSLDDRYLYEWEILHTALEKTRAKWGPYRMFPAEEMSEIRQRYELEHNTGKITVMYLGTTPGLERNLIAIHIPVDKDLEGYNVFLIRKDEQSRFDHVKSLDDLRQFTCGLGLGWIDVRILEANHFKVVTGSNYDGLFEMLVNKRFDVLLRSVVEVLDEFDERTLKLRDMRIESSVILFYPMPMYFWFAKTDEGRRLAQRAEEGMRMMIADGTFDRIFDDYESWKIVRLRLKERTIFRIPNPMLGPETPFADKKLWFDPETFVPHSR